MSAPKGPGTMLTDSSRSLLSKVYLSDSVVENCLAHAFITEKEEVMGVLLGTIEVEEGTPAARVPGGDHNNRDNNSKVAKVWSSYVMDRSVRLSDRVEVAAEMLINAAAEAERLSKEIDKPTHVIGWYHSHPQITQYPSIVDLNSQKQYQQMESGWVGLIFSLFHTDANYKGNCYIHCFQTGANDRHVKVPLVICSQIDMGLKTFVGSGQPQMLTVLKREIQSAVSHVRERADSDLTAMNAALGLQQAQLFTFERLLLEPIAKQLDWCSLPHLMEEVKRLEAELSLRSRGNSQSKA